MLDDSECQFLFALATSFNIIMTELEGNTRISEETRNQELAKMRAERDSLHWAAELKDRR